MEITKMTGIKKRQQIQMAGKTMFVWVAAAAVAISLAAVCLQFLYSQWAFNNKVISAKFQASSTLNSNIDSVDGLKSNVNQLLGNQDLASIRRVDSTNNLQVVLDALPSGQDVTALATSVQRVIIPKSGVSVESVTTPDATGAGGDLSLGTSSAKNDPVEQPFSIVVTGNYDSIRALLNSFEKSIRPMKVVSMNVSGSDQSLRATIDVVTYYQPAKSVNIEKRPIKQ